MSCIHAKGLKESISTNRIDYKRTKLIFRSKEEMKLLELCRLADAGSKLVEGTACEKYNFAQQYSDS